MSGAGDGSRLHHMANRSAAVDGAGGTGGGEPGRRDGHQLAGIIDEARATQTLAPGIERAIAGLEARQCRDLAPGETPVRMLCQRHQEFAAGRWQATAFRLSRTWRGRSRGSGCDDPAGESRHRNPGGVNHAGERLSGDQPAERTAHAVR